MCRVGVSEGMCIEWVGGCEGVCVECVGVRECV